MRETFTKIFDEILDYNRNVDNYEVLNIIVFKLTTKI